MLQSFQNYIDRLGLGKAELKCDQEPSTLHVANVLIKWCQIHESCCDCDAKKARKGAWSVEKEQISQFRDSCEHSVKPSQQNTKQKLDLIMS